jgi:hypothetical protein
MSVEKKPFKHHDKDRHYHPDVLTNGWTKNKLLIRFDDATADANGNYRFTINEPIPDVVYAEWITVSSGLVGSLMVVDEFNSEGQTTQKITNVSYPAPPTPAPNTIPPPAKPTQSSATTNFWRVLSDTNNYLSPSLSEALMNPRTLFYLNVKMYNVDGTKFTVPNGSFVQIFIWSYCCKA